MDRNARWTLPSHAFLSFFFVILSDLETAPAVAAGTISATSASKAAATNTFGCLKALS
ncbi:MAG TPA: hypothetical protein VLC07_01940 [Solirubrobacterales bacterium]|nr:hypothetical protein [Solirubrobacterales bacterium]